MNATIRIGCKINLYLEITGLRADGYHELATLFYPVSEPHDTLEITASPDGSWGPEVLPGLRLACSEPALENASNIVARAYEALCGRTGFRPRLGVRLTKGIPHGAGLGGGSADAAAMLQWLNSRAGAQALPAPELARLAASLGADVPFFLVNRPAWATGTGDRLEPAPAALSGLFAVICVPRERVNTAWAYKAFDQDSGLAEKAGPATVLTSPCPASMRPFCVSGSFTANSFEPVVFAATPSSRRLKERLYALGARAAGLSGSGSAVWGLFGGAIRADSAASALQGHGVSVFSALL